MYRSLRKTTIAHTTRMASSTTTSTINSGTRACRPRSQAMRIEAPGCRAIAAGNRARGAGAPVRLSAGSPVVQKCQQGDAEQRRGAEPLCGTSQPVFRPPRIHAWPPSPSSQRRSQSLRLQGARRRADVARLVRLEGGAAPSMPLGEAKRVRGRRRRFDPNPLLPSRCPHGKRADFRAEPTLFAANWRTFAKPPFGARPRDHGFEAVCLSRSRGVVNAAGSRLWVPRSVELKRNRPGAVGLPTNADRSAVNIDRAGNGCVWAFRALGQC